MATLKGIWVFNRVGFLPESYKAYPLQFKSNGKEFVALGYFNNVDQADQGSLTYIDSNGGETYAYDLEYTSKWYDEAYKTIEITSEPTDEAFITWLTANATQQASEEEETSDTVTVEYDGEVVATIPSGNKATIPVANKKMKTDIVITVPEAESGGTDSAIPTEVSTEAEMTALLTSGEVGGVYKYTGTTGTYENGALYVLEEEVGFTVKVVGQYLTGYAYYSVNGGEYVQIADENYVVGSTTLTKELVDSKCITLTNVTSLICKMTSGDVTFVNIKDSNFNDIEETIYGESGANWELIADVTPYLADGCYVIVYTDD